MELIPTGRVQCCKRTTWWPPCSSPIAVGLWYSGKVAALSSVSLFSRLNYILGGLHPYGFHVVNVLLHLVATLLFTYCCRTVIFRKSSSTQFSMFIFLGWITYWEGCIPMASMLWTYYSTWWPLCSSPIAVGLWYSGKVAAPSLLDYCLLCTQYTLKL